MLELYGVPVTAPGVATKLSAPLVAGGDVCRFEFSPNSSRVAYCADQQTDGVMELFSVSLASPGVAVKVNAPLVAGGNVTPSYEFSPDSSFLVYAADQDVVGRDELYRVDLSAPGVATKLNASIIAGGGVVGFHLRPDGQHLAYVANQENVDIYELYDVAFSAPTVTTKLHPTMAGSGVMWFEYASGSDQVVYAASQDSPAVELYRVDLAAPGTTVKLNGALTPGGEVWDFAILP